MFLLVHQQADYIVYGAITVFAAVGSYVLNFIRLRRMIEFKYFGNYNLRQHIKPILTLFAQSVAVSIYTNLDNIKTNKHKQNKNPVLKSPNSDLLFIIQ